MAPVEMTARAPCFPRMHRVLEAPRAPAPQHLRLRWSLVRPIRLEGHRPRGPAAPGDLWRYAPLLPLEPAEIRSRGEGGTPLHQLERIGSGGRVARLKVASLHVKDEGLNPTRTFKARGMAVAVPMACALGATTFAVPTARNAGAAFAADPAPSGARAIVIMASDGPPSPAPGAIADGAEVPPGHRGNAAPAA